MLNAQDTKGCTALHIASSHHPNIAKQLLEKGCDPDVQNNLGNTALHIGCS